MIDPTLIGLLTLEETAFNAYESASHYLRMQATALEEVTTSHFEMARCIGHRLRVAQKGEPAHADREEETARKKLEERRAAVDSATAHLAAKWTAYEAAASAVEARMVELGIARPEPTPPLFTIDSIRRAFR